MVHVFLLPCLLCLPGVPLLLGSLYGADFLQAALASTALPQQAALVLADQPQHVTLARFKALTDTMAAVRRLFGGVLGTAYAEVRWGAVAVVMYFFAGVPYECSSCSEKPHDA